ncbi:hypothetical protein BX666DRAFT_855366 [Dichotomocladium elegans]|nr:hypothetical protein BX666DRAFT_855366 [Dichotomocladium elegans]
MFSAQDISWIVYTIIFLGCTVILVTRFRRNYLLSPFILFAVLSAIALLLMISRQYQGDSVVLLADRSVAINHMPIFSLLLYAGLVGCQLIYIQHVGRQGDIDKEQRRLFFRLRNKPAIFWVTFALLLLYSGIVATLVCVRVTMDDNISRTRHLMAGLVVALTALNAMNIAILFLCRPFLQHTRDILFLRTTATLHGIAMVGMSTAAWLFYSMVKSHHISHSITSIGWIVLESLLVYLPIFVILVLSAIVGPIHQLGRTDCQTAALAGPRSLRFSWQSRTFESI